MAKSVAVSGNNDQEGFMTKTMKRALTAFLAIVMVFSYWSIAWADTGSGSNYVVEVLDELEFDGRTYTNLGEHGKYVRDNQGAGSIYMDQCDIDVNAIREKLGLNNFDDDIDALIDGTADVLEMMELAQDEKYADYGLNYLSILHVKGNSGSGDKLNVKTTDPSTLNDQHIYMWEMTDLSSDTDKYFLMYVRPDSKMTSQIRITQGNSSGESIISFVKCVKLTGFYIRETEFIEQEAGASVAGYGLVGSTAGTVFFMDDGYEFNYITGDPLHFVFERLATAGGNTNDTVEYVLMKNHKEVPYGQGWTVVPDDSGNGLNAVVTISDSVANQNDSLVLELRGKAPGGKDSVRGDDLSRPVAHMNIKVVASNPVTKISFKKKNYQLTTVDNKLINMYDELNLTPSSDFTDRIIFESKNTNVVTIDQFTGEATAVGVGSATIRAYPKKNPSLVATCTITVSKDLQQILIQAPDSIVQGNTLKVTYSTTPSFADGCNPKDITWTTSNGTVLSVTQPDANGDVYITAPVTDLGTDKVETVILTATGKNGVSTDKTITVYANTPSSNITYTAELVNENEVRYQKSLVKLGPNEYNIYDQQSVKIKATLTDSAGRPSTDSLEWRVTIEDADIDNMPLSAATGFLTYTYNESLKELTVTFAREQYETVILTGYAVGEAGISSPHAAQSILFNVNAKTTQIRYEIDKNHRLDNIADGDEFTIKYTLQPNSPENKDRIHIVSTIPSTLQVVSYTNVGRTGLIKLKAKKKGVAHLYIYATYDQSITSADAKYYTYLEDIEVRVKTNMEHVEITNGVSDKIFKNAQFTTEDILKELVVSYGGSELNYGDDFSIEPQNNFNIGTCTVKIIGRGYSYAGETKTTFKISPLDISTGSDFKVEDTNITYSGRELRPRVSLYVRSLKTYLTEGTDFALVYAKNVEAGDEATVAAFGIGNFEGSVLKNFTINPLHVDYMNISNVPIQYYNGSELKPDIPARNSTTGANLKIGIDYRLDYENNIEVGTGKITVTGLGNYTGTKKVDFTIAARNMADVTISAIPDQTFTFGEGIRPSPTVKFGDTVLTEGTDYRVDYRDNYNVGTATMIFIGQGDFGGETTRTFKINPFTLTASNTTVTIEELEYDGKAKTPYVVVKLKANGRELGRNDEGNGDYKVTYSNNVNSGSKAKVTITGTNNFKGSFSKNFTIKGFDIDRAGFEGIPEQDYTGKAVKPKVKLTFWDKTLVEGTDYKLAYSDNIKPGEATITVTGLGNFYGTKIIRFRIKDAAVSFNTDSINVVAGEQTRLPYNAFESVKFKTSNNSICTVNSEGVVFAKMAGKATITATSASGIKATITVQVLYKDVTSDADFWYEPTYYLTEKGVAKGYDNQTLFKPGNDCSRGQMVTFLWRLSGSPEPKAKTTTFKDVKSSDYFYKAVIWAVEKGITTGLSKTKFDPQGVCTRAQTVTFLWRMAGKPNPKAKTTKFKDVKSSDYFFKATIWASEQKIVAGYSDGTFKPQGKCLRRQMVTFLYKYDKFVNGKG